METEKMIPVGESCPKSCPILLFSCSRDAITGISKAVEV